MTAAAQNTKRIAAWLYWESEPGGDKRPRIAWADPEPMGSGWTSERVEVDVPPDWEVAEAGDGIPELFAPGRSSMYVMATTDRNESAMIFWGRDPDNPYKARRRLYVSRIHR